jgi:Holliday junction resolvase
LRIPTTTFAAAAKAAPQSEAEIQEAVMKRLHSRSWVVVRINGGGFWNEESGNFIRNYFVYALGTIAGFPDLLALKGRNFLLMECKDHKGKPTEHQKRFATFAARFGVIVYVVRSVNDVDDILQELKEELENAREPRDSGS